MLRKRRFTACVAGALPIGFIVGAYLSIVFSLPAPEFFGALPAWFAMILSITISSLIAVAFIGYLLLVILSQPRVIEPLKSHGLKTVT
jgi:fructose-specific phosphotransferase system IIC component